MAYDPTIPALNNYIGDDIPKIMANFAALAHSGIVDHNLDVANPPNGWYRRYDNGLIEMWHRALVATRRSQWTVMADWAIPATLASTNAIYHGAVIAVSNVDPQVANALRRGIPFMFAETTALVNAGFTSDGEYPASGSQILTLRVYLL